MEFLKIWEILLRRRRVVLGVFFLFIFAGFFGVRLLKPIYRAEAKLLVESSTSASALLSTLNLKTTTTSTSTSDTYDTDIALAKIRPLLEELIKTLELRNRKGKVMAPEELVEQNFLFRYLLPQPYLKVQQYEDSDMLELVAFSPDPQQAALIANKLAALYVRYRVEKAGEDFKDARLYIEGRIQSVKDEYYNSLAAVKDFKLQYNTVDLSKETENVLSKIVTIKTSFEDNEKTILNAEKAMSEARKKLKSMEMYRKESSDFAQSETLKTLKTKLNEILLSITEKSATYTKEHPEYKKLEKEVETIKTLMKEEAESVFSGERFGVAPVYDQLAKAMTEAYIDVETGIAKRRLIQKYLGEYQAELMQIPVKSMEGSKLELSLSVSKSLYQNLLQYMNQVGIAESMALSNVRLVDPATVPEKPHFPKKLLAYAFSLSLGAFWSLAAAFFIEYLDNTFKTAEDVRRFSPIEFLGAVPESKGLKAGTLISSVEATHPVAESLRTIRNAIRYASIEKPARTIAVTSSADMEGKTTVAANLAISFAMEGKRVVLVDLDLRKPSLDKLFKASGASGITNIVNEGLKAEDAVQSTGVQGLDLLSSGPVPADPGRIVESARIKEVIDALALAYDTVIIDTPPVVTASDAAVIGRHVDGALYVIEAGRTAFDMAGNVKEIFTKAGVRMLGSVLNKFSPMTGYPRGAKRGKK